MHYCDLLWDWSSIDSVRSVHSTLEGGAIVFFALLVLFDVLAHLSDDTHKERAKRFERIGLCCFGVAVLAELIAYPYSRRNDELSGTEIRELSAVSKRSRDDADAATRKAKAASDVANAAKVESGNAEEVAGAAQSLARGARKEADAFETRLGSAEYKADEAEKHLSDTLERATKAEQESARLTAKFADRSLSDAQVQSIGDALSVFAGQEYDIVTYWDTPECMNISNRIHAALQVARWRYIPPPETGVALFGGITGVQVFRHPDSDDGAKRAADSLISLLNVNGVYAQLKIQNPKNNPKHNRLSLSVGTKR
jgi:hypothetical protein